MTRFTGAFLVAVIARLDPALGSVTARGVVWLTINSTETGSSDYLKPAQLADWMAQPKAAPTATLMDEEGGVGKS